MSEDPIAYGILDNSDFASVQLESSCDWRCPFSSCDVLGLDLERFNFAKLVFF
jgi:hypothetical protein